MKIKKIIALIIASVITLSMFSCFGGTTEAGGTVRIAGLKGPTGMGMVKLLDDSENGLTVNDYEYTLAGSADEITPKFISGELDIISVPMNLGSVLYNKTEGGVEMIAVNTLGVLYIVEKGGETVNSLEDLKGRTVYASGKGSSPEYVLNYLLEKCGLDPETDVDVQWKSEHSEVVTAIAGEENAVALLPQPFVTVAQNQIEGMRIAVDLNAEWDRLVGDSSLITSGIFVRKSFAEENPDVVEKFLEEYRASTEYVNANTEEAATLIEKYDIVKAAVAVKALPYCAIVCYTGDEMKNAAVGYLEVLYNFNAASVGGALPGDDFYRIYD